MALQKQIASVFGISGNYVRIEEIHTKYATDEAIIHYAVYVDDVTQLDKEPINRGTLSVSLTDLAASAAAKGGTLVDLRDSAYAQMKLQQTFTDALDV